MDICTDKIMKNTLVFMLHFIFKICLSKQPSEIALESHKLRT